MCPSGDRYPSFPTVHVYDILAMEEENSLADSIGFGDEDSRGDSSAKSILSYGDKDNSSADSVGPGDENSPDSSSWYDVFFDTDYEQFSSGKLVPDDRSLGEISEHIETWKRYSTYFNLTGAEEQEIQTNCPREFERRVEMLRKWKKKTPIGVRLGRGS